MQDVQLPVLWSSLSRGISTSALSLSLFASCGSTIFHADFNADPLGGDPAMAPAGDPLDDRVIVLDAVFGTDSAVIVNHAEFSSRTLAILHPEGPGGFRSVNCISNEEDPSSTEVVSALWTGLFEDNGGPEPLTILFKDASSQPMAILRLDASGLSYSTSVFGSKFKKLGPLPADSAHSFILTANRSTDQVVLLAVERAGTVTGVVETFPLLTDPAKLDWRVVVLQFVFEGDLGGPERYIVDELTMKRDPPATPAP